MSTPLEWSRDKLGPAGRVARAFLHSRLTPLSVVASVLLGLLALATLPREEEPQIKVPVVNVHLAWPGAPATQVERQLTTPVELHLWEVPDLEYLYSTSQPGQSLVIVRFEVGEDVERSLVKLNQKLQSNFDRIPHGVHAPLVKPRSIDDVPILALTFHSRRYDHLALRRLVAQVAEAVKQVPRVAETSIIGGARRQVRVLLDPVRLASRGLSLAGLVPMLQQANRSFSVALDRVETLVRIASRTRARWVRNPLGHTLIFDENGPYAGTVICLSGQVAVQLALQIFKFAPS